MRASGVWACIPGPPRSSSLVFFLLARYVSMLSPPPGTGWRALAMASGFTNIAFQLGGDGRCGACGAAVLLMPAWSVLLVSWLMLDENRRRTLCCDWCWPWPGCWWCSKPRFSVARPNSLPDRHWPVA
jgi:hypothetical protein